MCVLNMSRLSDADTRGMVMVTGLTDVEFAKALREVAAKLKGDVAPLFSGITWVTVGVPVIASATLLGYASEGGA